MNNFSTTSAGAARSSARRPSLSPPDSRSLLGRHQKSRISSPMSPSRMMSEQHQADPAAALWHQQQAEQYRMSLLLGGPAHHGNWRAPPPFNFNKASSPLAAVGAGGPWSSAPAAAGRLPPDAVNKEFHQSSRHQWSDYYDERASSSATPRQKTSLSEGGDKDDEMMKEAMAMLGELSEQYDGCDGGQSRLPAGALNNAEGFKAAGKRKKPSFDVNKASRLLREHAPLLADMVLPPPNNKAVSTSSLNHNDFGAGPSAAGADRVTSSTTSAISKAAATGAAAAAAAARSLNYRLQAVDSAGKSSEGVVAPKKAFELLQNHAPLVVEMLMNPRGNNDSGKQLKDKTRCPKVPKPAAIGDPEFMQAFELLQRYMPYFEQEIRELEMKRKKYLD